MQFFRNWPRTNQAGGFILALIFTLFLIYLFLSPWTYVRLRDGFTLGFFPILSTILLILFSLILIFDNRRKEVPAGLGDFTFKSFLITVLAVIVCWSYFTAMRKWGFLIITPIFVFLSIYLLGFRSWGKGMFAAVLMAILVYVIFRLMGVELP